MPVMLKIVNGIAQAHADKTIVLMGCGDNYVALVAQAKDADELADNIVAPYAPYSMLEQCQKKEIFYELCEKHGEVSSARIVMNRYNGKSKGFGFVVMPNRAEAEKAIAAYSEMEYMGRKMRVNEAKNTITG